MALAEYLNKMHRQPEQVQDFYPVPGTLSTCMYYTGIDPRTMKPVYVARSPHEKALQRALLQWKRPEKHALVLEALRKAGRTDLIGYTPDCLIRPKPGPAPWELEREEKRRARAGKAQKEHDNRRNTGRPDRRDKGGGKDRKDRQGKQHTHSSPKRGRR